MKTPSGYVIYQGPSLLDGAPIVCIATVKSRNVKTGPMLQTWILRQDVDPLEANRRGLDASVCGSCPARGMPTERSSGYADDRSCYVQLAQAPLSVWRSWRRGIYPTAEGHAAIAAVGRGRFVRLGAYGDQAAVPGYVASSLLSEASGHTAYSHQSGAASSSFDGRRFMVSADSRDAAAAAWLLGHRTFRVVGSVAEIDRQHEVLCPASKEAGHRTVCASCRLCGGSTVRAKSIAIPAHGGGKSNHVAA